MTSWPSYSLRRSGSADRNEPGCSPASHRLPSAFGEANAVILDGAVQTPYSRRVQFSRRYLAILLLVLLSPVQPGGAAEATLTGKLDLTAPLDFQVYQRTAARVGPLEIAGSRPREQAVAAHLEFRLMGPNLPDKWRRITKLARSQTEFRVRTSVPAGGWYRLEVRVRQGQTILSQAVVEHVGVGEVFVIAGQSNSANHGEEKQQTRTGLVSAFSGKQWGLSRDPQPGASGGGGSFAAPFGDAMATRFKVPIGIIAAGVGATSVREWLPRGSRFPNPPTLIGNVRALPSGQWESTGVLFDAFITRLKQAGPGGFRAVLWHQGESDANQADPTRTLSGANYARFLEQLIRESRRATGWEIPWFVALASYHVPTDTGSAEIRAAQASLWKTGVALEGPDSDAITGEYREGHGRGVHFSGPGLRLHATRWAEKVGPWLTRQLMR